MITLEEERHNCDEWRASGLACHSCSRTVLNASLVRWATRNRRDVAKTIALLVTSGGPDGAIEAILDEIYHEGVKEGLLQMAHQNRKSP